MARYLLDTTTIIDHLRGNKKVDSRLEAIGQRGDAGQRGGDYRGGKEEPSPFGLT